MDSFSLLGLAPDACPAEIKRAYRRLAMAWHPDRNSHPDATERFKQIRAAYDALVNREEEGVAGPEAAAPEPAAPEPPRAPDIRLDLEISLEEGAAGCRKAIRYPRGKACATCAGSGESGISRSQLCAACHGSGRIRHRRHGLEPCADCNGRGFRSQRVCPDCAGSGRAEAEVSLEVSVPPGLLSGDELRLAGQGEPAGDGLAAGDLFLTIRLAAHDLFTLTARNLHLAMPVSALALLAGGRIEVPTLAGSEAVDLEPGTSGERSLRLAGRGYPGRGGSGAGDLVLQLIPVQPRALDRRQRQLLLQAEAALEKRLAECLPEIAAWRERVGKGG